MTYSGTVSGNVIELDEPIALPEGTRVEVTVHPATAPRRGSRDAVLQLVGTLSHEEAEALRRAVSDVRRIDPSLWAHSPR